MSLFVKNNFVNTKLGFIKNEQIKNISQRYLRRSSAINFYTTQLFTIKCDQNRILLYVFLTKIQSSYIKEEWNRFITKQ